MTPETAVKILATFEFKHIEALKVYTEDRRKQLYSHLEYSKDNSQILSSQGALAELRMLENIRDTAMAIVQMHKGELNG